MIREKLFSSYCGRKYIHTDIFHHTVRIELLYESNSREKYSVIGIINQNVKENNAFIAFAETFP